jgi:hypothetical protein
VILLAGRCPQYRERHRRKVHGPDGREDLRSATLDSRQLVPVTSAAVPALVVGRERASIRFLEFFAAQIRKPVHGPSMCSSCRGISDQCAGKGELAALNLEQRLAVIAGCSIGSSPAGRAGSARRSREVQPHATSGDAGGCLGGVWRLLLLRPGELP